MGTLVNIFQVPIVFLNIFGLSAAMEVFAVVMTIGVLIHMWMMVEVYRSETFSLEPAE
jgi:hypothetical protein